MKSLQITKKNKELHNKVIPHCHWHNSPLEILHKQRPLDSHLHVYKDNFCWCINLQGNQSEFSTPSNTLDKSTLEQKSTLQKVRTIRHSFWNDLHEKYIKIYCQQTSKELLCQTTSSSLTEYVINLMSQFAVGIET